MSHLMPNSDYGGCTQVDCEYNCTQFKNGANNYALCTECGHSRSLHRTKEQQEEHDREARGGGHLVIPHPPQVPVPTTSRRRRPTNPRPNITAEEKAMDEEMETQDGYSSSDGPDSSPPKKAKLQPSSAARLHDATRYMGINRETYENKELGRRARSNRTHRRESAAASHRHSTSPYSRSRRESDSATNNGQGASGASASGNSSGQPVAQRRQRTPDDESESVDIETIYHRMPARLSVLLDTNPASHEVQLQHAWNPLDASLNMFVKPEDLRFVHRHPVAQSTDAVRGKQEYTKGIHAFEIHWPLTHRGTHASVGLSTIECPTQVNGYSCLVGDNAHSWGWELSSNKLCHDGEYSEENLPLSHGKTVAPDTFIVVYDHEEDYLGFVVDGRFLGRSFRGLKGKKLYLTVSAVWGHCDISMKYIGGMDPEALPLMDLCRHAVRQTFSQDAIATLPLPKVIKNYLAKQEAPEPKKE